MTEGPSTLLQMMCLLKCSPTTGLLRFTPHAHLHVQSTAACAAKLQGSCVCEWAFAISPSIFFLDSMSLNVLSLVLKSYLEFPGISRPQQFINNTSLNKKYIYDRWHFEQWPFSLERWPLCSWMCWLLAVCTTVNATCLVQREQAYKSGVQLKSLKKLWTHQFKILCGCVLRNYCSGIAFPEVENNWVCITACMPYVTNHANQKRGEGQTKYKKQFQTFFSIYILKCIALVVSWYRKSVPDWHGSASKSAWCGNCLTASQG